MSGHTPGEWLLNRDTLTVWGAVRRGDHMRGMVVRALEEDA